MSGTTWVQKSIKIPLELAVQLEALNINFSRFVREAIEEKLNGRKDEAFKSILDYKLNELDEKLEQALSILSEVQQEQDKLKRYISTLKEEKEREQEQQKKQLPQEVRERLDSLKKEREAQDAALKEARAFIEQNQEFVASVDWSRFTDLTFRLPEPIRDEARELDKKIRELHGSFASPSYHVALALGAVENWIDREEKRLEEAFMLKL